MVSSLAPASAASRICARLSFRAACCRRSAAPKAHCVPPRSNPRDSVCSSCALRFRGLSMNRTASDSRPDFTPKQGQYLAFIHAYTLVNGRPSRSRYDTVLQSHAATVHQMVLTLEHAGLISRRPALREPLKYSSIKPPCQPSSRSKANPSKSLCQVLAELQTERRCRSTLSRRCKVCTI